MVEFNGKKLCENCFSEWTVGTFCTHCGYNPGVTVTDPTLLKPGSVLLGKYIVGKVIGKGGFGVTYMAYDITTSKKVAIKEFFPYGVALRAPGTTTVSVSSMDNAEAFKMGAEKFYNEAKLVSKFNGNPNIVGVHEFFYENDTVYFAMEFLQGHTLEEHIQEHGALTPAQALFLFQNVSNALMAAHSLNVMHRDISPDNIILCDNGDVKLIDFGAARRVVAEHSQSFSVILKPGFAPLEQYQKKGNQGPWTDIYSLGMTVYHALTGDIPEDPMSRIDYDEEFSSNKFHVEAEIWAIIKKATQLKIEDRYSDVFMLRNDLNKVSYQPEPVIVPKETPSDKMPDIHTAVPFGMTQAAAQPVQQPAQPVTVAAGNVAPIVQPAGNPVQQETAAQPKKKPSSKKITGVILTIAAALILVIGAAVIIPKLINRPDTVKDFDMGDGRIYSGEVADGVPNGKGQFTQIFEEGSKGLGVGTFENGKFTEGRLLIIYKDEDGYQFESGSFNDTMGAPLEKDRGIQLIDEGYWGGEDQDGLFMYSGTFDESMNLIKGEHLRMEDDEIDLLITIDDDPDTLQLDNGYNIEFDKDGNFMSGDKTTNGEWEDISVADMSKISELKKYTPKYIKNVISTRYGYIDEINECLEIAEDVFDISLDWR